MPCTFLQPSIGGLVGVARFHVLPQVGSGWTFGLSLLAMAPCLVRTWKRPEASDFPAAVLYCTLVSFFWGCAAASTLVLGRDVR